MAKWAVKQAAFLATVMLSWTATTNAQCIPDSAFSSPTIDETWPPGVCQRLADDASRFKGELNEEQRPTNSIFFSNTLDIQADNVLRQIVQGCIDVTNDFIGIKVADGVSITDINDCLDDSINTDNRKVISIEASGTTLLGSFIFTCQNDEEGDAPVSHSLTHYQMKLFAN
jgi:hypothetical protein